MIAQAGEFRRFMRVFFGRKVVLLGTWIILGFITLAIFASQIAPHDPYSQNLREALQRSAGSSTGPGYPYWWELSLSVWDPLLV
jgi:ABC-type antimicrobial peptide transport system permease subunit